MVQAKPAAGACGDERTNEKRHFLVGLISQRRKRDVNPGVLSSASG